MILRSIFRIILVLATAVIVVISVALYTISRIQQEGKKIQTPSFVGMNILDAYHKIEKINKALNTDIHIKVEPILNDKFVRYKVINQIPTPGLPIKEGNKDIVLKVSAGANSLKVPNFIGKDFIQVQNSLHKNNVVKLSKPINKKKLSIEGNYIKKKKTNLKAIDLLMLGNVIFVNNNKFNHGTVISQNPKPGLTVNQYAYIDFKVSLGKNSYVKIPSFIGKNIEPVTKILESKNIIVKIKSVKGNPKNFGKIIKQNINPKTKLFKGDSITLHVVNYNINNALNNYKMIKFIVPVILPGSLSRRQAELQLNKTIKVKITTEDSNNKITIFEGYKNKGDKIIEWVNVLGKTKVVVYLNDKKYLTYKT